MAQKTAKPRLWVWDNIKFFLILSVVVAHFIDLYCPEVVEYKSIYFFVLTYTLPLFVFILGLFAKSTVGGEKLKTFRLMYYLILYFFLKMLIFLTSYILNGQSSTAFFDDQGVQWYIIVTVMYFVAGRFFYRIKPSFAIPFSIFIACICGYDYSIGTYFNIARFCNFLPFFLAGLYLDPAKLAAFAKKIWVRIPCLLILALDVYICFFRIEDVYWFRPMMTGSNSYRFLGDFMDPIWGAPLHLLFYAVAFLVGFSMIACTPQFKLPYSFLGKYTLQVYFWHRPIVSFLAYLVPALQNACPEQWKLYYALWGLVLTLVLCLPPFGLLLKWLEKVCKEAFIKEAP